MPNYRYDDICDLCPPGRRRTYPEPDRVQHWQKHHPELLALMVGMLRDQKEGFGWRPTLPTVNDDQAAGVCPQCGPAKPGDFRRSSVDPPQQGDSAQPVYAAYCVHCGEIIRLECWLHSGGSCTHSAWVTVGRHPSTIRPIGWERHA